MATPIFKIQSLAVALNDVSPGSIFCPTQDANGNPINVSSGYTVEQFEAVPASNANPIGAIFNLMTQMTATFSTTGVTLSWTNAQATAMFGALATLNSVANLRLSNDSGTTQSMCATVTINLNPNTVNS